MLMQPESDFKVDIMKLKPSELLRLALIDLERVEKMSDKYKIDMTKFYHDTHPKCVVCLAGAVLVCELNERLAPINEYWGMNLTDEERLTLYAISDFQFGNIKSGLLYYQQQEIPGDILSEMKVTRYWVSPQAYKRDVAKVADYLESKGY